MSERRTGIPYDRMKVKADVLGIELDPLIQMKFDTCVGVIVAQDAETAAASTAPMETDG